MIPTLVAVIAGFGAWIAACQMWIAREKLRLDAFDRQYNRRVAVYEATRTFLADVFNGYITESKIQDYGLKTLDAQFLFDADANVYEFLREVRNTVAQWNHVESKAKCEQSEVDKKEYKRLSHEYLKWIREQGDQRFPVLFAPFLVYKPAKHPWYLRWLPELDV